MTKARERMGFEPKDDFDGTMERMVKWEMREREEVLMAKRKNI